MEAEFLPTGGTVAGAVHYALFPGTRPEWAGQLSGTHVWSLDWCQFAHCLLPVCCEIRNLHQHVKQLHHESQCLVQLLLLFLKQDFLDEGSSELSYIPVQAPYLVTDG